ncbi:MAG: (E)-4-hydroxy-3-methylbut-2-enyl-diphosphate synthase [Simkania sp.]|nr:(E)-4-hydroxy-3-methylbut-2-enyl-diphosphate synthase [Simkania sp.]
MKYNQYHRCSERFKTREVMIGKLGVGADHPVRIQSMTTSNTRDVSATIEQVVRLVDAGCEIVRMTVQGMKEAEACEQIKNGLIQKGYDVPLVADIHFFPPAAMRVIDSVEKVRINPGNFADKRATFKVIEYNESSYQLTLEHIEETFAPLVDKCKKLKRALRIGTNHGSLSDRIMNYYGDTPRGMVESAFEYARICRKYDFHNFLFSMKASNPLVMIQAYRLIVAEMLKLGWDYPLHLGVTEAGEGEDGRIKSAIGMGSLLLDGIGDTIRVSLTENPWFEIDPCQRLVKLHQQALSQRAPFFEEKWRDFMNISRRAVVHQKDSATHRDGSVFLTLTKEHLEDPAFYLNIGCEVQFGRLFRKAGTVDAVIINKAMQNHEKLSKLSEAEIAIIVDPTYVDANVPESWQRLITEKHSFALLTVSSGRLHTTRQFFEWILDNQLMVPVLLAFDYALDAEDTVIHAAAECGALLADGLGEGLALTTSLSLSATRSLSFNILQGVRMRASKTEFISCPGCGRTLFHLQEVTKSIRQRTGHLPGVKIAVMGCIVNGPGEMADADFGYVGSKPGKIDLYVGKQCVERDIAFDDAVEKLVALIKSHGRWKEPEEESLCIAISSPAL